MIKGEKCEKVQHPETYSNIFTLIFLPQKIEKISKNHIIDFVLNWTEVSIKSKLFLTIRYLSSIYSYIKKQHFSSFI